MQACTPVRSGTRRTKPPEARFRPEGEGARAYACVYRQVIPSGFLMNEARQAGEVHEDIRQLLRHYDSGITAYDWGDDPSFFSADHHQGTSGVAAWGVCRPNIRRNLHPGDVMIFFCARRLAKFAPTEYLFTGYATVARRIEDRREIYKRDELAPYRSHLNVLVDYNNNQRVRHERFEPGHPEDWEHRADSPYIIFDPALTRLKLRRSRHVASASPGEKNESWHLGDPKVRALHDLLFGELEVKRKLRTSSTGSSHPHINLTNALYVVGGVSGLRARLRALI